MGTNKYNFEKLKNLDRNVKDILCYKCNIKINFEIEGWTEQFQINLNDLESDIGKNNIFSHHKKYECNKCRCGESLK